MLNRGTNLSLHGMRQHINKEALCRFFQVHKDKIKTVALPILVIAAVLFFWLYGNAADSVTVQDGADPAAAGAELTQATAGEDDTDDPGDTAATTGSALPIYVDICGEVRQPGVYQITEGTRLFEVIRQAGGLTENADINVINQAETVCDGQKIRILSYQETAATADGSGQISGQNGAGSGTTGGSAVDTEGKVDLNRADAATLQTIPGIGPSKAQRILEYRETSGPFAKIEDIKNVSGIGNKTFESIRDYLTVS